MKNLKLLMLTMLIVVFNACSSSEDGNNTNNNQTPTSITITADALVKPVGQTVTFTVKDNTGNDVTTNATILVNDVAITGNTLTSSENNTYRVKAQLNDLTSNQINVIFNQSTAPPQSESFVKRVLIEDYTGAWCGWCPRVSRAIELVYQQTDKVVVAALHNGSLTPGNAYYDPYHMNVNALATLVNVQGYPTAKLDRMTTWATPEPSKISQVTTKIENDNPKLGLALKAIVQNGNIKLDVKTKFTKDFTNLKLVVYVLENGLILDQVNYTNYYGGADIITDFEHNHVYRAALTDLLGQTLQNDQTKNNNILTTSFDVDVPQNVQNVNNMEIIAFVIGADNRTINARKATIGTDQDFEMQP